MNKNQALGLIREVLKFASLALLAYGIGTATLWQEVTGGAVALVTLGFSVWANEGWDILASLLRTVLQSFAAILIVAGKLTPEKAEPLIGLALTLASVGWTVWEKSKYGKIPPAVPLLLLCACASCLIPGCGADYPIHGRLVTPYGTITEDAKGNISARTEFLDLVRGADGVFTVIPKAKPITIPVRAEK